MIRTLLCTTALLVAAPAVAQQAAPAATPAAPTQAAPQAATPAAPAQPATGAQPAAPAEGATTAQQTAQPAATDVASVVNSEFASYDVDKDGNLNEVEFAAWMTALKKAEVAQKGEAMEDNVIKEWASNAFITADADKNKSVTKPELVTFLGG